MKTKLTNKQLELLNYRLEFNLVENEFMYKKIYNNYIIWINKISREVSYEISK